MTDVKIKTSELTGAALDWAVAKCQGYTLADIRSFIGEQWSGAKRWHDVWAMAGPIVEREGIEIRVIDDSYPVLWSACLSDPFGSKRNKGISLHSYVGHRPLIAAMRCYVASKLGDEIEIPKELL